LRHHLSEEKRAHLLSATFSVLADGNHLRALLFSALIIFSGFTVIPYITVYAVNNVGIALQDIPIVYLVGGSATFISARLIGHWADKHGKVEVYRRVALLAMIPTLVLTHIGALPLWGWADHLRQLFRIYLGADDSGHGDHRLVGPAQAARHFHVAERHRAVAGHGTGDDAGRFSDHA
jgi:hypothetical protein